MSKFENLTLDELLSLYETISVLYQKYSNNIVIHPISENVEKKRRLNKLITEIQEEMEKRVFAYE